MIFIQVMAGVTGRVDAEGNECVDGKFIRVSFITQGGRLVDFVLDDYQSRQLLQDLLRNLPASG